MTNIFYNTEIKSDNLSSLERLANCCFTPVRYFWQGRTIEICEQKIVQDRLSFLKQTWYKTAVAVALLVPGLFVGTIAKVFSYCFASARLNHRIVKEFDRHPFIPPVLKPEEIIPFRVHIAKLEQEKKSFSKR